MEIPINLIVAVSNNNGIGYKGSLPWNLKKELQHFSRLTREVKNPAKKNAVIMGRKTWDSLPQSRKPLSERYNFILSTKPLICDKISDYIVPCISLEEVVSKLKSPEYVDKIETAWVIGGSTVYDLALKKNLCDKIYLTRVMKDFECDTFFNFDLFKGFKKVMDDGDLKEIHEENDIQYVFEVFQRLEKI